MIADPTEHEPLTTAAFDASTARAFVRDVVRETDEALEPGPGWPSHPEDRWGDETTGHAGLYSGAAGTMWALTALARSYELELRDRAGNSHYR